MSNGNIADFARSVRTFSDQVTALFGNQITARISLILLERACYFYRLLLLIVPNIFAPSLDIKKARRRSLKHSK